MREKTKAAFIELVIYPLCFCNLSPSCPLCSQDGCPFVMGYNYVSDNSTGFDIAGFIFVIAPM